MNNSNNEKDKKDSLQEAIDNFSEKTEVNAKDEDIKKDGKDGKSDKKMAAKDEDKPKKKKFTDKFKSRAFKRGWLAVVLSCVFIVAVVIVNLVANLLVSKFPALNVDLTSTGMYQLSEDTIDFLKTVDKDVTIKVLASEEEYTTSASVYLQANSLLKLYPQYSDHIKIEYIDLVSNPTFSSQYPDDEISAGNYIVESDSKHRMLTQEDLFEVQYDYTTYESYVQSIQVEPAVTTAILNVTSEDQTKVAFLDGFGDYSADGFKKLLESNNYDVSNVTLLTGELSSDISMAVLFTPSVDLDETSAKKISDFLYNNGEYGKNLMIVPSQVSADTPVLDSLLEEWGMKLANGLSMETDSNHLLYSGNYAVSTVEYAGEDYTTGLKNSSMSVVAGYIRPVEITDENMATAVLTTTENAKLVPYDADDDFDIDNAESKQYNVAAISKQTNDDGAFSSVSVFGSTIMLSDDAIKMSNYNNGAYIANIFNILTEHEDDGIAISGKDLTDKQLGIVSSQSQVLIAVFVVIVPLAILAAGFIIWLRRRNR